MSVFEHIKKENLDEIERLKKTIEDLKNQLKAKEETSSKIDDQPNIDQIKEDFKQAMQNQKQTH